MTVMNNDEATRRLQLAVTRVSLGVLAESGFALAGAGAIRAHGLSERPTEDVDLFTVLKHLDHFASAVDSTVDALRGAGFDVEVVRQSDGFARMVVNGTVESTGDACSTTLDMGIDWRAHEPVPLSIGPVLAEPDAVANKVAVLYSRGEVRDFLDVDSIRSHNRFTDDELLSLAANSDPGFDTQMFVHRLRDIEHVAEIQVVPYRVTPEDLAEVKRRFREWATQLRGH